MKRLKRSLIFLSLAVVAASCHRSQPNRDPLDICQEKIDRGNYDEAETDLRTYLDHNPRSSRARVILASVSLARAGITIRDYFRLKDLFVDSDDQTAVEPLVKLDFLSVLEVDKDATIYPLVEFLRGLNLMAKNVAQIDLKVQQIRTLTDEQWQWVEKALVDMAPIQTPAAPEALYRGVIKIFLLKARWTRGQYLKVGKQELCRASFSNLQESLQSLQGFGESLLTDLQLGLPRDQESLGKQKNIWSQGIQNLVRLIQGFSLGAQSLETVFSELGKQPETKDLFRGLKCDF